MKKLLFIPFFALIMAACGPGKKDVIAVNDQMVEYVAKCSTGEKAFFEACSTYDAAAIAGSLNAFNSTCHSVKTELEGVKIHKDLEKLKEATLHLVNTYAGAGKEYAEYARLYSIKTEDYTKEDEAQTRLTAVKINTTINKEFDAFKATQKEFSLKYDYSLVK